MFVVPAQAGWFGVHPTTDPATDEIIDLYCEPVIAWRVEIGGVVLGANDTIAFPVFSDPEESNEDAALLRPDGTILAEGILFDDKESYLGHLRDRRK